MSKFKVGDKVRVKSKEWYEKNKDKYGDVCCSNEVAFIPEMALWLGCVVTIVDARTNGIYWVEGCSYRFTDDMLEDSVVFDNPFECDYLEYVDVKEGVLKEETDSSILLEAENIRNGSRQSDYDDAVENFETIAKITSILRKKEFTPQDCVTVMLVIKLVRESFKHKRDNLVDLCGYADILEKIEERLSKK